MMVYDYRISTRSVARLHLRKGYNSQLAIEIDGGTNDETINCESIKKNGAPRTCVIIRTRFSYRYNISAIKSSKFYFFITRCFYRCNIYTILLWSFHFLVTRYIDRDNINTLLWSYNTFCIPDLYNIYDNCHSIYSSSKITSIV